MCIRDRTVDDVSTVKELSKISVPRKIVLVVADDWKSHLFSVVKDRVKSARGQDLVKAAMQDAVIREHGSDAVALIQRLVKDPGRIPAVVLHQEAAFQFLQDSILFLKDTFGCEVVVVKEQDSQEPKAKQALPGKPAIIVS